MNSETYPPRADSSETVDQWLDRLQLHWWYVDNFQLSSYAPQPGWQFKRKVDMVGRL